MHLFWTITATLLIVTISYAETNIKKNVEPDPNRGKRNVDYTVTHSPNGGSGFRLERRTSSNRPASPPQQAQRRISSQYGNQRTYNSLTRRHRPNTIPPYAVQMEPLVQYSQRDPLFDGQKPLRKDIESHFVNDNKISAKSDNFASETHFPVPQFYPPPPLPPPQQYGPPTAHHHHVEPPEPIIEIIIKESNISLPPPPTLPPQPRKKESVQVFYVKYKKDPYGGKDAVIYDTPIPAVTPATNVHNEEEVEHPPQQEHHPDSYEPQPAPPPSTTLRTIIKPDSEVYHTDSNVHVTFGTEDHYHHEKSDHEGKHEESAPQPSLVFPNTPNVKNQHSIQQLLPQASSQVQKRQPAANQQSQFSGNSFQSDFSSFNNNNQPPQQPQQPYYRPFPQPQYSTIQLGPVPGPPSFPRPQGPFHTQGFPPNQKFFPRPPFYNKQPFPPQFLNNSPNPPFYQGLPHVQQRQPFNQNPSQQPPLPTPASFNSFPQKTEPPQVYKTIRLEEPIRQPNYQTIKQTGPPQEIRHEANINTHINHNRNPIPTSNPVLNQQNYHEQQRPQFPPKPQPSFPPQQNPQQSFQYFNQNLNKIPNDNSLSSPFNYFIQQQERNKNQQQSTFLQPNQNIPQSQQQNQGNILPQGTVLPPGGELLKSIPKFEQHLSIAVPNTPAPTFKHPNFPQENPEHRQAPNHNYNPIPNQQISQISQQSNQQNFNQQSNHQQQSHKQQSHQQPNLQNYDQQQNHQNFNQQQNHPSFDSQHNQQSFNQQQQETGDTIQYFKSTELDYRQKAESSETGSSNQQAYTQRENSKINDSTTTTTTEQPINFNLPDEVPDELRQQLLSSGILKNADISVLDYDKIGDIPIEALPPDQLANFYGAAKEQGISASEPIRSVVTTNGEKVTDLDTDQDYETSASEQIQSVVTTNGDPISDRSTILDQDFESSEISEVLSPQAISMKVVHYDDKSLDDISIPDKYVQDNATELSPVVLNDKKYTRYLPLKVSGAQFPIPDVDELRGKSITSVVVLAPIDYDFSPNDHVDRIEREIQCDSRVNVSMALQELIKNPTTENFKFWLQSEGQISNDKQAVVLLVTGDENSKEIFMYDILTKSVSRLDGELSTAFVEAAESNVQTSPDLNQDLLEMKDVPSNSFTMEENDNENLARSSSSQSRTHHQHHHRPNMYL